MGAGLAIPVGEPVSLTERLVDRLLHSDVPLDRESLTHAARGLLPQEAPLAGPEVVGDVVDALVGLGPVEALLRDTQVSDVLVNRFDDIWVERDGRLQPSTARFADHAAVTAAVERVIAPLGLRIDRASPAVDARLPDGSRLHAAIPPIALDGPMLAVRRFTGAVPDLETLVERGAVDSRGAELLREAVAERKNVLVSGPTGAGKTTLLSILSKEIPAGERVVTVEDAAELRLSGHVVRLEARPANAEGAGRVGLNELVRHALRLRPDRLIVGEVRGPESFDLISAMTTGHAGSMGTVHAGDAQEALWRLEMLALAGDRRVAAGTFRRMLIGAVDVVVEMTRMHGVRQVAGITSVDRTGVERVYSW